MLSIQYIINIFRGSKAEQILYFLLFISILQIFDLVLTIYLSQKFGEYLILGSICTISLFGLFITVNIIKNLINQISGYCNNGIFPEKYFYVATGSFVAAFFIFIPGIISGFFGFTLLFPFLALRTGKYISYNTKINWHTVYDYMQI